MDAMVNKISELDRWISHNSRIILHNFNVEENKLKALKKFATKQKRINKKNALLMIGFIIYICWNEERQINQTAEFDELKEEVEKLKGEEEM